ncbi:MAG: DUF1788 domain-containing protein [Chloroflexi bacterium]|nr:DUF1788 domain-containing protein [Chloroflexota bacterium]
MGWPEAMDELETKLRGWWRGTYRTLDNVPFFRLQYPPTQEREALRQFSLLADRLRAQGFPVQCISLTDVLRNTMQQLTNAKDDLSKALCSLETSRERIELQGQLSELLAEELPQVLCTHLVSRPRNSAVILLRFGALYPFVRSSTLLSRLENRVRCAVVLPYPGTTLGAVLDVPEGPHVGYYRGEIIAWR